MHVHTSRLLTRGLDEAERRGRRKQRHPEGEGELHACARVFFCRRRGAPVGVRWVSNQRSEMDRSYRSDPNKMPASTTHAPMANQRGLMAQSKYSTPMPASIMTCECGRQTIHARPPAASGGRSFFVRASYVCLVRHRLRSRRAHGAAAITAAGGASRSRRGPLFSPAKPTKAQGAGGAMGTTTNSEEE
jgi:hypothetical protein